MKNPALTRALSVFLVIMCAISLISGAAGAVSAAAEKKEADASCAAVSEKAEAYRLAAAALEENGLDYDAAKDELKLREEEHDTAASEHRTQLAEYTATRSGLEQGENTLYKMKNALKTAWEQYNAGLAEFMAQAENAKKMYELYDSNRELVARGFELMDSIGTELGSIASRLGELKSAVESGDEEVTAEQIRAAYAQAAERYEEVMTQISQLDEENYKALNEAVISATGKSIEDIDAEIRTEAEQGSLSEEEFIAKAKEGSAELIGYISQLQTQVLEGKNKLAELKTQAEDALAQLEAGMAELDTAEKTLDDAKAQLESGDAQIESGLRALWKKFAELDDTQKKLAEQRDELVEDKAELGKMQDELDEYSELEAQFRSARAKLMRYDGIKDAAENGEDILSAAESYRISAADAAEKQFVKKLIMSVAMLIGSAAGIVSMICAFRRSGGRRLMPVSGICCLIMFLCACIFGIMLDVSVRYLCMVSAIAALLFVLSVTDISNLKKHKKTV